MARFSNRLARLALADERIDEYQFTGEGEDTPHWLHLSNGWINRLTETHIANGRTVSECLAELRFVEKCSGDCCKTA